MNSLFRSIPGRMSLAGAVAGAVLAGLLAGGNTAGAATRPGVVPWPRVFASGSYTDWPMFRADPGHSGVSPETAIGTATAKSLAAGWTATLGTSSYASPAVATSSALGEAVIFDGAGGKFYAYSALGGTPIWTFKTGKGGGGVLAGPAVFDDVVYFATSVGTVWALDADTGAVLCSYATGQLIQAAPVVVSDPDGSGPVLYVGTDPPGAPQGAEYAIYGPGNTHGSCALDWKFTGWADSSGDGTWSAPAYGTDANGNPVLVFGSRDPDDSVYALYADTGALDWRYQTSDVNEFDVGAAPTISPPGQNGFADGVVYVDGKDKSVYALDLTTGSLIWSYALTSGSNGDVSSTALDGNAIYLGSDSGVWALNATTGALLWNVLTQYTFYGSPAITGPAGQQVLIIGNNEGRLYALNITNGATVWSQRPTKKGFWASPAVSQGGFYDIAQDGILRSYFP
jgi:eukaryotic-like serine/threonine-protein kinase